MILRNFMKQKNLRFPSFDFFKVSWLQKEAYAYDLRVFVMLKKAWKNNTIFTSRYFRSCVNYLGEGGKGGGSRCYPQHPHASHSLCIRLRSRHRKVQLTEHIYSGLFWMALEKDFVVFLESDFISCFKLNKTFSQSNFYLLPDRDFQHNIYFYPLVKQLSISEE